MLAKIRRIAKRVERRVVRPAAMYALRYGNGMTHECPICRWTGFLFDPTVHRRAGHANSKCPNCGSNERARFAYVVMSDRLNGTERVLHFAPEKALTAWLKSRVRDYVSADINPAVADHVIDITEIAFPDNSFDLVWCSHVLEHVPDDGKAMREIHRVLRPGGIAMIQVPLWHDVTDEDIAVTDPEERIRRFYQKDHVRLYGYDIEDRLREAGFSVEVVRPHRFPPEIIFRHQIAQPGNMEIFLCTK